MFPLAIAASHGDVETTLLLLNAKADVTMRDAAGNTALHSAVLSGSARAVTLLISHGADVNAKNDLNQDPLNWLLSRIQASDDAHDEATRERSGA